MPGSREDKRCRCAGYEEPRPAPKHRGREALVEPGLLARLDQAQMAPREYISRYDEEDGDGHVPASEEHADYRQSRAVVAATVPVSIIKYVMLRPRVRRALVMGPVDQESREAAEAVEIGRRGELCGASREDGRTEDAEERL